MVSQPSRLLKCMRDKVRSGAGKITETQARVLGAKHARALEHFSQSMSPAMAQKAAADQVNAHAQSLIDLNKKNLIKQFNTQESILEEIASHPLGIGAGTMAKVGTDLSSKAGYSNMEIRQETVRGIADSIARDMMELLRPRGPLGLQPKPLMRNVIQELSGKTTGNADAVKAAKAWRDASDYLRDRFNAAGGNMPKMDNYVPHRHDSVRFHALIRQKARGLRVGGIMSQKVRDKAIDEARKEWVGYITPMLDRKKMLDYETGLPLSPAQLGRLLESTFENIRTNGLNTMKSGLVGSTKLANRYQDPRVLHFRDADSWLAYDKRFGSNGDHFGTLTGHFAQMSRDIGTMETFSPNPDAMADMLHANMKRNTSVKALDVLNHLGKRVQMSVQPPLFKSMYERGSGMHTAQTSQDVTRILEGTRNLLVSAQLGSATMSAFSDIGLNRMARYMTGLSQIGVLNSYFKQFSVKKTSSAIRLGLHAESWTQKAYAAQRHTGEMFGNGFTRNLADTILRTSGLSAWTQAGRHSFGLDYYSMLADQRHLTFSNLPDPVQRHFQRYGIEAKDWNLLRKSTWDDQGVTYIDPIEMARSGKPKDIDAGSKLLEAVTTEMERASPKGDLRVQTIQSGTAANGTILSEIAKSHMMYKSFPMLVITQHMMRGIYRGGLSKSGGYLAGLFSMMTIYGAMSLQAKEVSKGRDPRPMDTLDFWYAAALQGGGLGLFGDFLFSDVNRFGNSMGETFAGPMWGLATDLNALTFGNVGELMAGEETHFGREALKFAERYTPGSSLWFLRAGLEKTFFDNMERLVDPDAVSRQRSYERKARKEGRESYWRPGQVGPERAPDLGNALGRFRDAS